MIVVVANTPHVLDPRPEYTVDPLRVTAWTDAATDPRDAGVGRDPRGASARS